jgi:protein arginine N-methyltransferase 1
VDELTVAGQRVGVRTVAATRQPLTLFPSVGEYLAYDTGTYDGFQASGERNRAYGDAVAAVSAGRCVLDIGTGRDALWAIAAARAGARRVLAIEASPAVAAQAREAVRRAGLSPVVTVLAGWSAQARLPEPAEVCVSELIGNIASAEGVLGVLADARRRLCAPGCVMIPGQAQTLAAPVSLTGQPAGLAIARESLPYLQRVFDRAGRPFDLRLCLAGPVAGALLSPPGVVEELACDGRDPEAGQRSVVLTVTRPGVTHGFALWIRLGCARGQPLLDGLPPTERGWAPVFVPARAEGIAVRPGDQITVTLSRSVQDRAGRPDYGLTAEFTRPGHPPLRIRWDSPLRDQAFRATASYRALFPAELPPAG